MRWIKCSEHLPVAFNIVLIYQPRKLTKDKITIFEIIDTAEFQGSNEIGYQWFSEGHGYVTPTHWMPLPDAPEVEK